MAQNGTMGPNLSSLQNVENFWSFRIMTVILAILQIGSQEWSREPNFANVAPGGQMLTFCKMTVILAILQIGSQMWSRKPLGGNVVLSLYSEFFK